MFNLIRLSGVTQFPGHFVLTQRNCNEGIYITPHRIIHLNGEETDKIVPNSTRILESVGFLGIHNSQKDRYMCFVRTSTLVLALSDVGVFSLSGVTFIKVGTEVQPDAPEIAELNKFLTCGSFYFSYSALRNKFNITLNQTAFLEKRETDTNFLWNGEMLGMFELAGIDYTKWTVDLIAGFCYSKSVYFGAISARACLISRTNRERAGTRFSVRGVDDEGSVANYVETEQLICLSDMRVASFLILRGSVPLFWEQSGTQVGAHKVNLSRSFDATFPAFSRHTDKMKQAYGDILILNLLGNSPGEFTLTYNYQEQAKKAEDRISNYINFDYHAYTGTKQAIDKDNLFAGLMETVMPFIKNTGYVLLNEQGLPLKKQTGIIRINCIDCLDRTNSMQKDVSLEVLQIQMAHLGIEMRESVNSKFQEAFKALWISNGHAISKLYAGTDSLVFKKSRYKNVLRNAERVIQSSMFDSRKNNAILYLLKNSTATIKSYRFQSHIGTLIGPQMLKAPLMFIDNLYRESSQFCLKHKLRVFVGTWNVNGMQNYQSIVCKGDIGLWLLEGPEMARKTGVGYCSEDDIETSNDIYAIGFEEMVDLNAANIITGGGNSKRLYWADEIEKKISTREKFCLISSLQLVGVCLFVFARQSLLWHIKDVITGSVKTGIEGTAGNKGAVALRMQVYNTTICFVCSHFAAGQANVAERNSNFSEILRKMTFNNWLINDHDYVFWCGDLNYRIDLSREIVLSEISRENWSELLLKDQLCQQRGLGHSFSHFSEGPINFPPTYKYDLYLSEYDTSDKCRVPAWTDRVLWSSLAGLANPSDKGRLIYYGRAELVTSDHRPVGAIIEIDVEEVVPSYLENTTTSLLSVLPPFDGSIVVSPYLAHLKDSYNSHFSAIGQIQDMIPVGGRLIIGYSDPLSLNKIGQIISMPMNGVKLEIRLPLVSNWVDCVLLFLRIPTSKRDVQPESEDISSSKCRQEMPNRPPRSPIDKYQLGPPGVLPNLFGLGDPGDPPL